MFICVTVAVGVLGGAELAAALSASLTLTDADAIEALISKIRAKKAAVEFDLSPAQARVAALRAEQDAFTDPTARRRREAGARAAALEARLGMAAGGAAGAEAGSGAAMRCDWCGKPLPAQSFNKHVFRYCTSACVQAHSKQL
eukprot:CAMPEP_0179979694 /NCGR_PEP_ID=MMETSP0983-20121128/41503_1 /TAXON_ID=483367 /ORGANISM="non described non described, Strain CCMP 2436" /LENGTH=142 /DNA_ID=CAMNT_0021897513 /DNA_START=259 /DNA_END=688 /DNA_ORIENTATION=-